MTASTQLNLNLFGRFHIERDGESIRLPTRKAELLLAYLVLHPEPVSREKLAALIWPDVADDSARASLRNELSTLRRKLGRDLVQADRDTAGLNPDFAIRVDTLEFREQATRFLDAPGPDPGAVDVDLYAGVLLEDFYDEWVLIEREAYRDLYLEVLLELTQQMRSHSKYQRAVEFAERTLVADRANERAHQHLMFCHVALGDRGAALKQYEACRNALTDELAVEPSSATVKLYDWIRQAPPDRLPVEASITNLPIPVTDFVGRQHEMAAVKELLPSTRLVTLTGAGGSGKTRLAIQVATELLDAYSDGVWWVELTAVSDGELLPRSVAKALGVPEVPNQPITDSLVNFLRSRHLLLVLDNCEHLITACAQLAERLLAQCPQLKVLATSREMLGIAGERIRAVPTLTLPDPEHRLAPDRLLDYEAIELFVGRAVAAKADFKLSDDSAPAIVDICRRLDGLPLAIELAAARVNVLDVEQIAARLDDVFHLLTGASRTALAHHQTLRAAIDWSVDLLSEQEDVLLRRLSVFSGGWTLPAAEAVCSGEGVREDEILGLLSRLVDQSLVEAQPRGGEMRFDMLETIRQYSRGRLLESGEFSAIRTRHLHHFLQMVEAADPHVGYMLPDAEMERWLGRLEPEQDNLLAAVRWSAEPENVTGAQRKRLTEAGMRLLSQQHAFWFARGRFSEERTWLSRLLERSPEVAPATRARALMTLGYVACWQGDFAEGRAPLEEAKGLYRSLGDAAGLAFTTNGLGFVAMGEGDVYVSASIFEKALQQAREANDEWIMSFALHCLAVSLSYQGNYERATSCFEEGCEILQRVGGHKQGLAFSLFHLGRIARIQGDCTTARSRHIEGMTLFREAGDRRGIGYSLAGLAVLAATEGDMERAARLSGAVASLEAVLGAFLEAPLQAELDRELAAVEESLGEEAFNVAADEGRAMRVQQAIDYALKSY